MPAVYKIVVVASVAIALTLPGASTAAAPHAKGMALCYLYCSKSERACQDRCVPRGLSHETKICITRCHEQPPSKNPIEHLSACFAGCLNDSRLGQ
jgi:hypothetical protein